MTDIFLTYCAVDPDQKLAEQIAATLSAQRIDVFMAALSLQPGELWSEKIRSKMEGAGRVLFLASERACKSAYVQQELGGAHFGKKTIIPFVWDINAGSLPGFIHQYQAVDLSHGPDVLMDALRKISDDIVTERRNGIIALAAFAGMLWYLSK